MQAPSTLSRWGKLGPTPAPELSTHGLDAQGAPSRLTGAGQLETGEGGKDAAGIDRPADAGQQRVLCDPGCVGPDSGRP
jgi:hypothetical protein